MTDLKGEASLIKQAQSGDAKAFEALLNHHYDTLFRFAFKWCGKREDAEDIAQQSCIKLARGLEQFRFESSFTSWLYRLVINCAKDWQKNQARHSSSRLQENTIDKNAAEESAQGHFKYDQGFETTILVRQLLNQLEDLADGMKETALLVHAEGFTHKEAATILGIKESTISWRIHEIRRQLQPAFGREAR